MTISLLSVIGVVIFLVILGIANWYVGKSPILDPDFKSFIKWILLGVGALVVIWFILSLFGFGHGVVIS